jgi:EmrB/QacA subfamily drug resistance transporter
LDEQRRFRLLLAATAGAILVPLNTSMLAVALSPIIRTFDVPIHTGTWLVLVYLSIMTGLQPTAGKLGDRYGHRRIFLGGLLLFGIASAGAALAPNFPLLVFFRGMQGLTATALTPNASAMIRLTYPIEHQGKAMGLYVSAMGAGLAAGPVISGLLIEALGWQAVFWVNLPVVVLSYWVGYRVLPTNTGRQGISIDWLGTALFMVLITGAVGAISLWQGAQLPVPLWTVLPLLAVVAALLVYVEGRVKEPLLSLPLFRQPGFPAANAAIFLQHLSGYIILIAIPLYLQFGRGVTGATAGLLMGSFSLMQVLAAPYAGRLSDHLGRRLLVVLGGLACLAPSLLLLTLTPTSSIALVLIILASLGIGKGLSSAPIQAAALAACPPDQVGIGSGIWYCSRYLGNVTGALLAGLLLPIDAAQPATVLYLLLAGSAALLSLTARFMPSEQQSRSISA